MEKYIQSKLISYLEEFVTPEKIFLFNKILNERTRYLTLVLENIFQPQNASAVIRSCECFGIQDVHIIENSHQYRLNPDVVLGASQWLNLKSYNKQENNTIDAIMHLKRNGYRIVATTPGRGSVDLDNFNIEAGKAAIFFGTERTGLSKTVLNNADEFLHIPMVGFTESLNISVSAAIILHHLRLKLHQSQIGWGLSEDEKAILRLDWLEKSIKKSHLIIARFMEENQAISDISFPGNR